MINLRHHYPILVWLCLYKLNRLYNYEEIFYENGNIKSQTVYEKNLGYYMVKTEDYYFKYRNSAMFPYGIQKNYYENGNIKSVENYSYQIGSDGPYRWYDWIGLHGKQFYYHENGNLKKVEYWKKSKPAGIIEIYDLNGVMTYTGRD
jgi:antitoxin component YwqK of YwqJK toxin-antitoxin module